MSYRGFPSDDDKEQYSDRNEYKEVTFIYATPVLKQPGHLGIEVDYLAQAIGILEQMDDKLELVKSLIRDLKEIIDEIIDTPFIEEPIDDMRWKLKILERLVNIAEYTRLIPDKIGRECGYMAFLQISRAISFIGRSMA